MATVIETFKKSLAELSVPVAVMPAADVTKHLENTVDAPAVGVPLDIDDVSLPESITADPLPSDLQVATTGVTGAGPGIADYGSVVVTDRGAGSEQVSLFVDTHVAVIAASNIVESMSGAFEELGSQMREGLTSAVVTTGPSATADMGSLVTGAHGPSDVRVILVSDR